MHASVLTLVVGVLVVEGTSFDEPSSQLRLVRVINASLSYLSTHRTCRDPVLILVVLMVNE